MPSGCKGESTVDCIVGLGSIYPARERLSRSGYQILEKYDLQGYYLL